MYNEINSEKLKEMMQSNKELQLVDVREPYEFESGNIPGAKLIPLGEFQGRYAEVDKSKPVVFICRSGARSRMACQFASAQGYESYNLTGGMMDWD